MAYRLNISKDVDITPSWDGINNEYFLWLPFGYRFSDDLVHCRGFDTLAEVKRSAKNDVIECDCEECSKHIRGKHIG